jgi:hypothetical protein
MSSLAISPQLRAKCRNFQQAIFSENVHTQFVYARSMQAISGLCSLRPPPASSITSKPRRPPSVSLGLGIRPVAFRHRPSFCPVWTRAIAKR